MIQDIGKMMVIPRSHIKCSVDTKETKRHTGSGGVWAELPGEGDTGVALKNNSTENERSSGPVEHLNNERQLHCGSISLSTKWGQYDLTEFPQKLNELAFLRKICYRRWYSSVTAINHNSFIVKWLGMMKNPEHISVGSLLLLCQMLQVTRTWHAHI